MYLHIKRIRSALTTIELELGSKAPDTPNFRVMTREIEEIEDPVARLKKDATEVFGTEF